MNPNDRSGLQVIILAAGFSSRLGAPKAHARVRSATLLRRTLALAAGFTTAPVLIVVPRSTVRSRFEARGFEVAFVVNRRRAEGLSSSVRSGIARARNSSAALILPVDMAALKRRDLERLISRWRAARRRVVARRIGPPGAMSRGGAPLILPRWLYARALHVTGDIGLRELMMTLSAEQRTLVNLPSAELDVDTPQDLRAARRQRRSGATL
jgi:molybdenum cofactor cytidylyltransferase